MLPKNAIFPVYNDSGMIGEKIDAPLFTFTHAEHQIDTKICESASVLLTTDFVTYYQEYHWIREDQSPAKTRLSDTLLGWFNVTELEFSSKELFDRNTEQFGYMLNFQCCSIFGSGKGGIIVFYLAKAT